MENNIRVSIICNTFNQEKYIASALEGFVCQKTNFAFEVLVHDDASTDNTPRIIRSYAEKYPDLIKPIYQTVNQYSQHISITNTYQLPRACGDYIAFCEGDDYWVDSEKLQKQFDLMEAHPDINMCAHAAYIEINGEKVGKVCPSPKDGCFSVEEVIINDGDFVATASLFFRKKIIEQQEYTFFKTVSYDYSWQILGSLHGGMLYLSDVMTVYRVNAVGSWSLRTNRNPQKVAASFDRVLKLLDHVNSDTDNRYKEAIAFQKNVYLFKKATVLDDPKLLKESKKYLCSLKALPMYRRYIPQLRLRKWVKYHFPWLEKMR